MFCLHYAGRLNSGVRAHMGRQVAVELNDEQERSLLAFLRSSADITLIRAASPNPDDLFAPDFVARRDWSWHYWLWNRAYPWVPEIRSQHNHVSIGNTAAAPLLEYTRHNFSGNEPVGRLYWAKDFASQKGLAYDSVAFSKWVDSVFEWVRHHGRAP